MNFVLQMGNVTKDLELRKVQTGDKEVSVVNFTLAVNRRFRKKDKSKAEETNFFRCEAWDSGAEILAKYVKKGDPLLVQGSLRQDRFPDKDGNDREVYKIRVDEFKLLPRGNKQSSSTDTVEPVDESGGEGEPQQEGGEGGEGDDNIPF